MKYFGKVLCLAALGGCTHMPASRNYDDGPSEPPPGASLLPRDSLPRTVSPYSRKSAPEGREPAESVLALTRLEGNVWRASFHPGQLFVIISKIISQRYTISQFDKRNLTLATEWDKFFIDGRLFRNKVSVTLFPMNARSTEIVFRNNVEYYSGHVDGRETLQETAWLPAPDLTDEVAKLMEQVNWQMMASVRQRSAGR